MTPETPDAPDVPASNAPDAIRRGRGRPRRDPSTPPGDPGVIGGRDAESFSRAILNSLSGHLVVIERGGRIVAVNKAWERLVEELAPALPKAPGLGDNYFDALQDRRSFERERAAEALAGLQKIIDRSQARFDLDYPLTIAGVRRWFELSATPLLGATGGAVIAHSEITELRRVEASNAEKNRLLEAVLESSSAGIVVADASGDFLLFNRAAREMAGVGVVESNYHDWPADYGIFQPDRVTPFRTEEVPLYRAMQGESTDGVLMFVRNPVIPGGRFLRISGRPWVLAEGERRGGVVVMSDVTADVLAEEQSRLQIQVLDAVPLAILALDAEGIIIYWNETAERLLGWSAAELVGRRSRDVLLEEDDRTQVDGIRDYLLAGKPFRGEFRVRRPDGSHRRILASASARHRADGTLDGFVVVGYDLSESRREQDAVGDRQAEIQQFQKMEAIGRLAGGLAHDFNNLLTVIRGYADLLMARTLPGDPLRYDVEQVTRAVDRAAELTAQLLAFGRQRPMEPVLLSINGVVSDFMPLVRRTLGEDVKIRVELDPDTGNARADASQLGQVLLNLVINARDAMPQGGDLTISTRNAEIDDTFPGAPVPLAPGAVRAARGLRHRHRHGRGNPGARLRAVLHHEGAGPRHRPGPVHRVRDRAPDGRPHLGVQRAGPRHDVPDLPAARVRRRGAAQDAPARAAGAGDARDDDPAGRGRRGGPLDREAPARARRPRRDRGAATGRRRSASCATIRDGSTWCITDVLMPGMTGRDVVEATRRMRPEAAVLYVSGHSGDVLARLGGDAAAPFLQKPFSASELHAAIRRALEQGGRVPFLSRSTGGAMNFPAEPFRIKVVEPLKRDDARGARAPARARPATTCSRSRRTRSTSTC